MRKKWINKYDRYLHKLVLLDMKYCKEAFNGLWDETYQFHKRACKEVLREENINTIDGIKNYIEQLKNDFE